MAIFGVIHVYFNLFMMHSMSIKVDLCHCMWSVFQTPYKFEHPQNCYRCFPIIVFVGLEVQYILESTARRFAFSVKKIGLVKLHPRRFAF